jgi:hypothetical protein
MLDHLIITVTDYERSKDSYEKALEPLVGAGRLPTGRTWI